MCTLKKYPRIIMYKKDTSLYFTTYSPLDVVGIKIIFLHIFSFLIFMLHPHNTLGKGHGEPM